MNGKIIWGLAFSLLLCTAAYAGELFQNYTSREGLVRNSLKAMSIDREGNQWYGAKGGGAGKFDGSGWLNFGVENSSLIMASVRKISLDSKGNLWFATASGVSSFDGTSWVNYTVADGLPSNNVFHIIEDRSGNYWAATGNGLARFDGSVWTTYTEADGLTSNYVTYLYIDSQGIFWIGTKASGITKWDGSTWVAYNGENGIGETEVRVITGDRMGNIWVGTRGRGAFKFDGTTWSPASGLTSGNVWDIEVDLLGNIWFATYGSGVRMFDGASWHAYTVEDGLLSNWVTDIALDAEGRLWFSTNSGISVFSPDDLEKERDGEDHLFSKQVTSELPKAFSLTRNAPNPFNPSTTINYAVPEGEGALVSLEVYNIKGKLVRTLVKSFRQPGRYNVTWDATDTSGSRLASGVYFYRMVAGNFVSTRKMVLLK